LWLVTYEGMRLMSLTLNSGETDKLATCELLLNTLGEGVQKGRNLNHIDLDVEAFPLCLGPKREGHFLAALVSSRQKLHGAFVDMSHSSTAPVWMHGVSVRAQPLLHLVLAHIMIRSGLTVAAKLAHTLDVRAARERAGAASSGAGQWEYAAELLVFLALDREISKNAIDGVGIRDVLEVLGGLSIYAKAVGSCARKIEAKYWPLLFPKGREATLLIRDCLSRSPPRPHLAAIFLVIIQATAGPSSAVQAAAPILTVALRVASCTLSYALAAQIVGFVQRSEEASHLEKQQLQQLQQHQDYSSWFSFAWLYATPDPSATSPALGLQGLERAQVPLPDSTRKALQEHVTSLVAAVNLPALSALLSSLGPEIVVRSIPPYSFPLPDVVPPLPLSRHHHQHPHQQQAAEANSTLYETRTVGMTQERVLPPDTLAARAHQQSDDVATPPPQLLLTEQQLLDWQLQQHRWHCQQHQHLQQQHTTSYLANFVVHIHALFVVPMPGGGAFLLPPSPPSPHTGAREGGHGATSSGPQRVSRGEVERQGRLQIMALLEPLRYWQLHLWASLLAVVLQAPHEIAVSLVHVPLHLRVAVPLAVQRLRGYAPLMPVLFADYTDSAQSSEVVASCS